MVGGAMPRILQLLVLGPWISRTTRKKMGILMHKPSKKDLVTINELYEAGKVKPVIDSRYPLSGVAEALRHLGKGHVNGKAVIIV
jgi:NADPH:quinone reductase-like Zn-dependent oxidoreductase